MFNKENARINGLSKEKKWEYIGKPVAIIFGSLNLSILIFFLISYYA
jgi:hypothetical protein